MSTQKNWLQPLSTAGVWFALKSQHPRDVATLGRSELVPVSKRLSLEGEVGDPASVGQGPGSCRSVSCPLGDTRMEPWGSVARHRAGCLLSQGNRNANLEPGYEAYSEVGSEAAAPWAPSESSFSTSNGNTELRATKTNSGHWRLPTYGQP